MYTIPPPETRYNSAFVFRGTRPCFLREGLDDPSPAKKLAAFFSKTYSNRLRYIPPDGWLVHGDDDKWRPGRDEAMQFARQFCHEAARATRSSMLTAESLIAEMLRLAELEAALRKPVVKEEANKK